MQIVELDGLQLLLPLTKSTDTEVQRLAAHALANLSVNCTDSLHVFSFSLRCLLVCVIEMGSSGR